MGIKLRLLMEQVLFQSYTKRCRLIRHTLVRVRENVLEKSYYSIYFTIILSGIEKTNRTISKFEIK